MRIVFSAPTGPGFSTNPSALHVPAEELMMWDGVKPALTTSAAATAWWMALHPPPQKTNRILPYWRMDYRACYDSSLRPLLRHRQGDSRAMNTYDICIIGAGVVGCAVAREL